MNQSYLFAFAASRFSADSSLATFFACAIILSPYYFTFLFSLFFSLHEPTANTDPSPLPYGGMTPRTQAFGPLGGHMVA
jgi:hypothetical protein